MTYDVLIAGLGPVGLVLGNLLGARGLRVLAVDSAGGPAGQPRAATTDDQALRTLQGLGLVEALAAHLAVQSRVSFVAADGRRLTLLETEHGPNGHPPLVGWHQPGVERVLLAGLVRFATVTARWGVGVGRLDPGPEGVDVGLTDGSVVRASWVVGCDGAGSAVRRLSGIAFGGSTFAQRWRVMDTQEASVTDQVGQIHRFEAAAPDRVDHVHAMGAAVSHLVDHVHFIGDPRRPAVTLPTAPGRHRWEFQGDASAPAPALAPFVDLSGETRPDTVRRTVEREAVYEFHARIAANWRAGRVFLAGDAAHVMPPFGGQGLSAGIRDAANLAWKLEAVMSGAPDRLLDTYELERRPEVRFATRVARSWGAVLQTRRPRLARGRDAALFAVADTPAGAWLRRRARPQPRIRQGILHPSAGAGTLFPQPVVQFAGHRVALDDCLGAGWAVLGSPGTAGAEAWRAVGARVRPAVGHGGEAVGARVTAGVEDAEGVISAWLERHHATWVALRPDRHVFASGKPDDAAPAAAAAAQWLQGAHSAAHTAR